MKPIPSQYLFIVLLVIGFVVAAALQRWRRKRKTETDEDYEWPFYAKKPLTPPEQVLYHRLVKALPEHIVLAQVQVSRILGVRRGFNFHEWNNRVNRMSYDFVVCAKDARVLAVIELDDKTHARSCGKRRKEGSGNGIGGCAPSPLARGKVAGRRCDFRVVQPGCSKRTCRTLNHPARVGDRPMSSGAQRREIRH